MTWLREQQGGIVWWDTLIKVLRGGGHPVLSQRQAVLRYTTLMSWAQTCFFSVPEDLCFSHCSPEGRPLSGHAVAHVFRSPPSTRFTVQNTDTWSPYCFFVVDSGTVNDGCTLCLQSWKEKTKHNLQLGYVRNVIYFQSICIYWSISNLNLFKIKETCCVVCAL